MKKKRLCLLKIKKREEKIPKTLEWWHKFFLLSVWKSCKAHNINKKNTREIPPCSTQLCELTFSFYIMSFPIVLTLQPYTLVISIVWMSRVRVSRVLKADMNKFNFCCFCQKPIEMMRDINLLCEWMSASGKKYLYCKTCMQFF